MTVELAEVRDFLAGHAPFADLPPDALDALPARLTARYFRRGSTLVAVGQRNDTMFILRSGAVDIRDAHGALVERADDGACFGMSSVLSGGPSAFTMIAVEDTLTLLMPGDLFHTLLRTHPGFSAFFMRQQASRIRSAVHAVRVDDAGAAIMRTRVSDIAKRAPVTIAPTASIRQAAQLMSDARISAILVTDAAGALVGILTDRDLRRVVATATDCTEPVAALMTPAPSTVTGDALAFEVLIGMTQRRIHHLPVVEDGRPVGMVTAGDLMRLEQNNPVYLVGDITKQTTLDGLVAAAKRLPHVVETLVGQEIPPEDIARVITAVGDALVRRLLNLAEEDLGAPPVRYCWVALGSQGRMEQNLGSDQDSALILDDSAILDAPGSGHGAASGHGAYFAALAERVVAGLEACGYPRCPGDMMASNPAWRLRLSDWGVHFARWINSPDSEALLHTQTFFDMRPLYGDNALHSRLAASVAAAAPGSPRFLQQLATQAQTWKVPLGFFRDFTVSASGDHRNTLDLKAGGIAAVVQIGRLLALARGLTVVNTGERLTAAAAAGALSAQNAQDLVDAYEFLLQVRLAHQARQLRAGVTPDNHVDPAELTSFEKRHLREAFEIIRKMQGALGHVYQTQFTS